jgi:Ca-activated chloride channel homolog
VGRHEGVVDQRRGRLVAAVVIATLIVLVGWRGWVVGVQDGPALPWGLSECVGAEEITVTTTPQMRPVLDRILTDLDRCQLFRVSAEPADVTAQRYTTDPDRGPMVWVPDSALLAKRVVDGSRGALRLSPAVATTPVLIAIPSGVSAPDPLTWGATIVAANTRLPDPNASTVGRLALATGLNEIDGQPPERRTALLAGIGGMLSRIVPEATLFSDHTGGDDPAIFPTTEQQIAVSGVTGIPVRTASTTTPILEYPLVNRSTTPPGSVGAIRAALVSEDGRQALRQAGFRTPDDLEPVIPVGPPAAVMRPASTPPADSTLANQVWRAITTPTRLLTVIDTSGSMNASAGPGLSSRIQVAAQAATGAIALLADQNSVGLWTFSTRQRGELDWTEIEPIQVLGREDHRAELAFSLGSLGSRLGGDTGLFDTLDAAYAKAVDEYDPKAANLVVLFTDGVNDDPAGGLSLDQLRERLAARASPAKPVTVLLIGMGGVDAKELGPVAAAIPRPPGGGAAQFTIDKPQDIANVYVTMLLRRLPQQG